MKGIVGVWHDKGKLNICKWVLQRRRRHVCKVTSFVNLEDRLRRKLGSAECKRLRLVEALGAKGER